MKHSSYKNLFDIAKAVLSEKFIVLHAVTRNG